jgi:Holliday junction resolvase
MKTMISSEKTLQRRIINDLRHRGWLVYNMPPVVTGFSDVMALKDGETIFLEIKKGDKGKVGYYQVKMARTLRDAGFRHCFVKNYDEYERFIDGTE